MDRQYREKVRDGSRVQDFAYRARVGEVNARVLAFAGYKPAQDYLGWPPHDNPWVKRALNGRPLPGVVPFEIWLDNLRRLGHKVDYTNILHRFDAEAAYALRNSVDLENDLFLEIENNYKQLVCDKIVEYYNVTDAG